MQNKYNLIVAADENWCIGNKGKLLDTFPDDMRFFRYMTSTNCVVMGDNTQRSLPNKYLKNRLNIVLCKDESSIIENIIKPEDMNTTNICYIHDIPSVATAIDTFNQMQKNHMVYENLAHIRSENVFIIGGGQVYRQFLLNDLIDGVYLTKIHHKYDGDTFIPNLYDLGFKDYITLFENLTNPSGIKYDIIYLKKR